MSGRTLFLLRHGAPDVAGRMLGWQDRPPSDAGIAACVRKAQGLPISRIVTSDLRRCAEGARAIARHHGLTPDAVEIDARWRELNFGQWDGLASETIDPDDLNRFWEDPDRFPPPGGECWSDLVHRVREAVSALPEEPTLIVTHGGAMRAALHVLCAFPRPTLWAFDLPYASLIQLRAWPGSVPAAQIASLTP